MPKFANNRARLQILAVVACVLAGIVGVRVLMTRGTAREGIGAASPRPPRQRSCVR
jgi:hypothetical protein